MKSNTYPLRATSPHTQLCMVGAAKNLLGDAMAISAAFLYGVSNILQEHLAVRYGCTVVLAGLVSQKSPMCYHKSPMCHQKSPVCYQMSHMCYQMSLMCHPQSPMCYQMSHMCYQMSHICHQQSPMCYQTSLVSHQQSVGLIAHKSCHILRRHPGSFMAEKRWQPYIQCSMVIRTLYSIKRVLHSIKRALYSIAWAINSVKRALYQTNPIF